LHFSVTNTAKFDYSLARALHLARVHQFLTRILGATPKFFLDPTHFLHLCGMFVIEFWANFGWQMGNSGALLHCAFARFEHQQVTAGVCFAGAKQNSRYRFLRTHTPRRGAITMSHPYN
jgi:hypothetical protein